MFLSNPAKSFLACSLVLIISTGCGSWRDDQNAGVPAVPEPVSSIPFSTKEPENFQCEMVVTAGGTVRTTFIARKGGKRRIDYDFGEANQRSVLTTDKNYVISYSRKLYAETVPQPGSNTAEGPWDEFASRLLSANTHSEFEEVSSAGGIKTYKVIIGNDTTSEILIYVDPAIGIPVKQEFFSVSDGQKTLQYSVEFRNLVTDVANSVFDLPKNLQKVSPADFQTAF